MICEIRSLIYLKLAYFRQFWSFIEWEIIECSWSDVDVYVCRSHEFTRIERFFEYSSTKSCTDC
jgi:hypothetical protein